MKTRNTRAMMEMFGLLLVLFTVATGGVLMSKNTLGNAAARTAVYQEANQMHNDHIGLYEFYNDAISGLTLDCLTNSNYDMNNFCPIDVDNTAALEKCIEDHANVKLRKPDKYEYIYKGHEIPKIKVSSVEKTKASLIVTITTETPIKLGYKIESISWPMIEQKIIADSGACT